MTRNNGRHTKKTKKETVIENLTTDDTILWFTPESVEIFTNKESSSNENIRVAMLLWYAITRPQLIQAVLRMISDEFEKEVSNEPEETTPSE